MILRVLLVLAAGLAGIGSAELIAGPMRDWLTGGQYRWSTPETRGRGQHRKVTGDAVRA